MILDKMGITERDLLVVGDAPNDISMFELANWSVAVGGAFEEIKKLADIESHICTEIHSSLSLMLSSVDFDRTSTNLECNCLSPQAKILPPS